MRNIMLTIEYDGSRYQGWTQPGQTEPGGTISGKITDVLQKMTGENPVELHCACRTEAGVHAYAQTASFRTETDMKTTDIKHYLNRYLPMDIAITDVLEAPESFDAKLSAVSKTYVYRMTITDVPSVFERKHTYHCFKVPDRAAMQKAAASLIGKHDFKTLSDAKKNKSSIREIYAIDIYGDDEEMQIMIHANDFIHNMARLIIGLLLDIGLGLREVDDVAKVLDGTLPPSRACDPKGLYLQEITY